MKVGDLVSVDSRYWDISSKPQHNNPNITGVVIELVGSSKEYVRVRWSHDVCWERTEALRLLSEGR